MTQEDMDPAALIRRPTRGGLSRVAEKVKARRGVAQLGGGWIWALGLALALLAPVMPARAGGWHNIDIAG